jgi:hypothetical protein
LGKGVEFEGRPQRRAWGMETVFRDPDGNGIAPQQA